MSSQNEEPKMLTETLDEITKLQEELQTRMSTSNQNIEANFENIRDFVSRAHDYIPILKQLSKDMVDICDRTQTLKKQSSLLEKRVNQESTK